MDHGKQAPLAVIGMACRVPGGNDLVQFWQLLLDGRCGIVEAPAARLDRELYYDSRHGVRCKTYTSLGGLIEYRPFDASKCPVPARILPSAEVGHRELCQVAADACRHAGMNPFDLPQRNVGVYVGHNLGGPVAGDLIYATRVEQTAQYLRELDRFRQVAAGTERAIVDEVVRRVRDSLPRRGPAGLPEMYTHMAAAILSEAFGLNGPSMILDAACSSALQGLAMASRALRLGRIDMAIVGGASFYHVDSQMLFSSAQSASASGSCPFDQRADGLVSGEGYLAILVKTLQRAMADGNPVLAVIRGIGVSADGRGKSLWAPRAEGQVLAMRRAYDGGLDIDRLQYVEAHATSTRLGDLTELHALAEILGTRRSRAKVPLGGVKANIGHTLESAGLAGLVKTILAINHKTIPQQIQIEHLNTGIDWDAAPFYVPTTNLSWPEPEGDHPRRGAVNSFGIGGLNVHVVVDEFRERPSVKQSKIAVVGLPGSAATTTDVAPGPNAREPIAIVGAGCIFPGARTLEAFWELLASGRDPKCAAPADRWDAPPDYDLAARRPWPISTRRGGFITDFQFDWRRHKLPPKQVAQADPLQLMILDATDAALADAGYDTKPYDKTRVGVVVGTIFGSDFCEQLQMGFRLPDFCAVLGKILRERGVAEAEIAALAEAYSDKLLEHMPALLDETGGFTPSTLASRITKTYDLMGGAATVDSGAASSLAALSSAIDTLADGSCDMMICAAGNRAMGLSLYESMSLRGDLAGGDPKSPFDAAATGHLPGEGVGVVVLRRLADARQDGDRIRGIIHAVGAGFAATCDEAVAQSIGKAYRAADVTRDGTLLLETAGTGRLDIDSREVAASIVGLTADARKSPVVLGTVVGQIGHTQGASGMASLMAAMGSLDKSEAPPVFGATEPIPPLATASSPLRLATAPTRLAPADDRSPVLAGINSIDPLGAAYHLVLQRGVEVATAVSETPPADSIQHSAAEPSEAETRIETPPSTPWRIVRIGAATIDELVRLATEAAADAEQWFARAETVRFAPKQPCRLALVARDAADLRAKLTLASQHAGTSKAAMLARNDVFVGQADARGGKVAFLFSGQGSQYPGMLRALLDEFPPAAEALRRIDAVLGRLNIPAFGEFAAADSQLLGKDVWFTQLSLLCA
ncbi:MAG TPA: hypothetical protein DD670_05015, partial [Planctomycetaceae bacterium]|nr:hypothetical protein [Planctomycetaceae bacterium]